LIISLWGVSLYFFHGWIITRGVTTNEYQNWARYPYLHISHGDAHAEDEKSHGHSHRHGGHSHGNSRGKTFNNSLSKGVASNWLDMGLRLVGKVSSLQGFVLACRRRLGMARYEKVNQEANLEDDIEHGEMLSALHSFDESQSTVPVLLLSDLVKITEY
jgi:hypothetical protein